MSTQQLAQWPPQLTNAQRDELTHMAVSYALSHGLVYLPVGFKTPITAAIHAPFTLFPTPYPRNSFHRAQKLQRSYNILYSRIAQDVEFLDRVMGAEQGVGKVDEFTGTLWKGWKAIRDSASGVRQPVHLGLFRSDYMLHEPDPSSPLSSNSAIGIKQVEFNTISVSFGSLSERTAALHRYISDATSGFYVTSSCKLEFPPNKTVSGLAGGLAAAHQAYGSSTASILFVVQPGERNAFDQRPLEYELTERHGIHVVWQTFEELFTSATVSPSTGILTVTIPSRSPVEISVIYYRSAYTPHDYPSQEHYTMRFTLESSTAIKCPTIPLQLAGGKKVQQVLTNPGVLESFMQDPKWEKAGSPATFSDAELGELRETWMAMWGLDEPDGIDRARNGSAHLVLKPQREGGGNNVYRSHIPSFLDTLPEEEREAWIAMEMIIPPTRHSTNWLAKAGEGVATEKDVVNELGIYGWALFGGESELQEQEAGWLVRTKGGDSDEGGVAVGFSVLDSVVLV